MTIIANTAAGNAESGPAYGCLTTVPRPSWLFVKVETSGTLAFNVTLIPNADVDFICWGPFATPTCGAALSAAKIKACDYSTNNGGTANIGNVIAGEYYMILLTNYAGISGVINLDITAGSTATLHCPISPGCVSAIKWWYKADLGVSPAINGSSVDSWADQSGLVQNVSQTGVTRPTYSSNAMNFNPSLNFSGTQNLLRALANPLPGGNKTIISVANATTLPAGTAGVVGTGGTSLEVSYGYQGGKLNLTENTSSALATTANTAGSVMLSTVIENSNSISFFNNGTANGTATTAATPVTNRLTIGSQNASGTDKNYFTGQISEVIVYNRALTVSERSNIESYLAVKYGLTIGHNYTNAAGITTYSISSHANAITGIGREDCQGFHQKQARNIQNGLWTVGLTSIATDNASNTASLSDATWLIFGDDGASMTATPIPAGGTCLPPAGADHEIPRRWKVVETGLVNAALMRIAASSFVGLNQNQPIYMVIASDASFTTNVQTRAMTKVGLNYELLNNFSNTSYFKIIGTGNTTAYCTGSSYLRWASNPWTAGSLTQTSTLSNGLTMTTTVSNPDGILRPGYPKMDGPQPVIAIASNNASKAVVWSMQFNQAVTGAGFFIYDLDQSYAISENVQVTGYQGAAAVLPTLSKSSASPVVVNSAAASATGGGFNVSAYGSPARVFVSFNAAIDRIAITYKNANSTSRLMTESISIGDISIYCPEAFPNNDMVYLAKIAPNGTVNQGDTISYVFKFNNINCGPQTVNFTDNLPTGMQWVGNSYTSNIAGATLNSYGSTANLNITGMSVPMGMSTFIVDAVATSTGTKNNQASFVVNGNTYQSDDPNQSGNTDATPVTISAPLTLAAVSITKVVSKPLIPNTGTETFTYTITNSGGSAVTMNFSDELVMDLMYFVSGSLSTTLGGTAQFYNGNGSLFITGMTVPVGTSVINVNVAMANAAAGIYANTAVLMATTGGYSPRLIPSNRINWTVATAASFSYAFDCNGSTASGLFVANGTAGQTGMLTIPINVNTAGLTILTISGSNFTGSLLTTIVSGQSSVPIPITYDGAGPEGARLLTVSSIDGIGLCSAPVVVQPLCNSNGGQIGF